MSLPLKLIRATYVTVSTLRTGFVYWNLCHKSGDFGGIPRPSRKRVRKAVSSCLIGVKGQQDKPIKSPNAPIAQLDRAADYGSAGLRFNSSWVHHLFPL
jgi:hypothetical protein